MGDQHQQCVTLAVIQEASATTVGRISSIRGGTLLRTLMASASCLAQKQPACAPLLSTSLLLSRPSMGSSDQPHISQSQTPDPS